MRHVDDPHLGREPGDHSVTGRDEAVGEPVVGGEGDPTQRHHDSVGLMRLCVFTEPQLGATYEDQLAIAQRAEQLGFEAFFRRDHSGRMSGDGLPGPTDSWVPLGALARETSTIRPGPLVRSATFPYPGP